MMAQGKIIMGYDNNGTVFDNGDFITRKVFDNYLPQAKHIFELYKKNNLSTLGIVETDFDSAASIFKHKKYTTTYPYEWTANMFKDAVLYHLKLFIELDKYGLFLKDALLNNIVFEHHTPRFVDFLSIIPTDNLTDDISYRQTKPDSDPRFSVIHRMFSAYILIPYIAFSHRNFKLGRTLLMENACNCSTKGPVWNDVNSKPDSGSLKHYLKWALKIILNKDKKRLVINEYHKIEKETNFIEFVKKAHDFVEEMNITPPGTGYDSYYEIKNEKLDIINKSGWKEKQFGVYNIIEQFKPVSLLDIGANTGWYSILAEKMGASVIATDMDESSIDKLYLYSKKNNLKITPLLMNFDNLTKEIYGLQFVEQGYENRDFSKYPIYSAPTERIKSEMVLVLALIHHLILGEGKKIEDIFWVLSKLTQKVLVLEFVDIQDKLIQDELIQNDSPFFKNINKYNHQNYNIDIVLKEGKKYFKKYEIIDSHPHTRKLIVFNN